MRAYTWTEQGDADSDEGEEVDDDTEPEETQDAEDEEEQPSDLEDEGQNVSEEGKKFNCRISDWISWLRLRD